jgi:hypothetical protein
MRPCDLRVNEYTAKGPSFRIFICRNQAEIEEGGKAALAAWSDHWLDFNPVACVLTASHDSQSELIAMAGDSVHCSGRRKSPGCDPRTAPWGALGRVRLFRRILPQATCEVARKCSGDLPAAVATSREGRHSPRSSREGQHRRWGRELPPHRRCAEVHCWRHRTR